MLTIFSVFIGGGIGSLLRWLATSKINSHWGVMAVNVIGAMLIGMAYQFFIAKADLRSEIKTFVITGFLGGFTTFSTYVLDFHTLVSSQKIYEALAYLAGSVIVGFIFLLLGIKLAELVR